MFNIQKLKDTDWNNAKEVTVKEIAEYLFSLIEKRFEETNETHEAQAPDFVIQKLNKCSKRREKEICSAIQVFNVKKVNYESKKIQYELKEGYSQPLIDMDKEENSTVKGLRAIFKYNAISEEFINYFLPLANDVTKWNRKKQITKIDEARIVARHLYIAKQKRDTLKKDRESIKKETNQQKRNQTEYTTITQWNHALKEQIIKELTAINTPIFKANRIASKCTSVVKKIISNK